MCNFTKGEWITGAYKIDGSHKWAIDSDFDCAWAYVGTKNKVVAIAVTKSGTDDEMKANANLIAAAPEMYEAIERVAELLEKHEEYTLEWLEMHTGSLTKLLAKARGEHA